MILKPVPHGVNAWIHVTIFCFEALQGLDKIIKEFEQVSLFPFSKLQNKGPSLKHKTSMTQLFTFTINSLLSIFSDFILAVAYWFGVSNSGLNHSYCLFD